MTTRRAHTRRIISALADAQRAAIATNPIAGIESLGYTVVAEPALTSKRGASGWCDGLSFAKHHTVMYAPTPGSKRENFTLLHEVAHILVENDDDALIWLADRDDPDVELERLCEEIAAALVVPEDMLDEVVGTGPITGDDLKTLVARSGASGPACAIALSTRLSSGVVALIDRANARVIHSALRGEDLKVYPWKLGDVPLDHPLLNLKPGTSMTRKLTWTDEWERQQTYYVSAVATELRVYVVFSVTTFGAWTSSTEVRLRRPSPTLLAEASGATAATPAPQSVGRATRAITSTARSAATATASDATVRRARAAPASARLRETTSRTACAADVADGEHARLRTQSCSTTADSPMKGSFEILASVPREIARH